MTIPPSLLSAIIHATGRSLAERVAADAAKALLQSEEATQALRDEIEKAVDDLDLRFRVLVHSDPSYPQQSRARVDRWDGVRWQEVHHVDPMAHLLVWKALNGYLPVERHGAVRAEAARFAAELLAVALRVVGP